MGLRAFLSPPRTALLASIGFALCASANVYAHSDHERNTLVPPGYTHYAPSPVPDRVVLTFAGDPATSAAVSWRTDTAVENPRAQIAPALDGPALHQVEQTVAAASVGLTMENGAALHHSVVFEGLEPDTVYAYRVSGGNTWSEWFQFRTASDSASEFAFIYFGDAQNAIKSHFSRVIRQAYSDMPKAALMVHAGDLVNSRDNRDDDEWGEWFDAGGWLLGMVPSVVAAGNHEFHKHELPDGTEEQRLSPHWAPQFRLPENGPEGLRDTVYYVDYQGTRFVVLDSTSALNNDTVEQQARWLETVLRDNPNRWTVVTYHHPMFSVSAGRDNPPLRDHWKPLFDRYGVDLVLQGHDHVYGRAGDNLPEGKTRFDDEIGTMYVVSVGGPKMYMVSDQARTNMTRVAEDTQLYQLVRVQHDRILFEARTPSGRLYDSFELVKAADGRNRLFEVLPSERRCTRPDIPGYRETRCWEGSDLIEPPAALRNAR
ncbi:hypothetical protein CAI21_13810 [Alkalilimnicola ehrlichii]|nr:hypothetical protein CAI21_13810 [Alkalilimnicola ehrlichii]